MKYYARQAIVEGEGRLRAGRSIQKPAERGTAGTIRSSNAITEWHWMRHHSGDRCNPESQVEIHPKNLLTEADRSILAVKRIG
jgi:hypothetical protein